MNDWKEYRFDKFVNVNPKVVFSKKENIPFVEMKDIDASNKFCTNSTYRNLSGGSRFENGDTLFARITPCLENGKIAQVRNLTDGKGLGSTEFHVLRGRPEISLSDFVYYLSRWNEVRDFAEINLHGTSGRQRFPAEAFKELVLNLPGITEQQSIAEVLSSLDDKIDLIHRQNKTLEQMAETLFRQWFIEEETGEWKEGCLGDFILNVKNTINANEIEENTRYIGLEHISRRNIALSVYGDAKSVVSNKFQFSKGNILFGKLRPYFHKVCIAPFDGVCSTDILVLKPKTTEYTSFALFALFQNDVIEYSNASSGGTRMPRTSWEILKRYPIKVPPLSEIKLFEEQASVFIEKVFLNIKQIESLEDQRDLLLNKLMNGSICVTNN